MNPNKKSRSWIAGMALTVTALACNLPGGALTPTLTPEAITEEATLPALPTVIALPEDCIATANQNVNMRTGPGQAWPVVSQLASGNSAKVTGHNGDSSWWQLNDSAWVSASLTSTSGDCNNILVAGFPAAPSPTNAPTQASQPTQAPTNAPTQAPQPTQAPTNAPTVNVAFDVDYGITWFCGNDWRVSFILYNRGNANIESVYYSVEGPPGSYLNNGTTNNAPFEATAKETQPACAQPAGHGQSSLASGAGLYVPINLSPLPVGVTEGFLYIEACPQDNRLGNCASQIMYFIFTT